MGNLTVKIDAKNQKTEYVYDDAGRRVSTLYYAAGDHTTPVKTVTFTYDNVANLLGYNDGTTSAQYKYDDLYRKTSESVVYSPSVILGYTYTYYKNGMKKSFTGPDGVTYEYGYDGNKKLAEVVIPGVGSISYNAYNWTKPISITLPGATQKQYTYGPLMRVESISVTDPDQNVLMDYNYSYDRMNNILTKSTEHGVYTYGYDARYQLISADNPTVENEVYTYDPVGNRLTSEDVTGSWEYNTNDELLTYDDNTFAYDATGNTTKKIEGDQTTNYIYNIEDRMIHVGNGEGNVIASYYYDPFGRRLWKDVEGVLTCFVYAEEGLTAETDETGTVIKTYGFQPESDWTTNPLFMKKDGQYYFYQNDHLGTPLMMTDAYGNVMWSAQYKALGKITIDGSTQISNFRFPGQYYDTESELNYNFQRYYEFNVGRYFRQDPLDVEIGFENTYAYAHNNPVLYYDSSGEHPIIVGFAIVGAGTATYYTGRAACEILCAASLMGKATRGEKVSNCDNCHEFCSDPRNWFVENKADNL